MKNGLVLTGGGARGAYQVGVLRRVSEIPALKNKPIPFPILTGASAGAVNVTFMASTEGSFYDVTSRLVDLWSHMEFNHVFRTDIASMSKIGASWIRNLSFGGLFGTGTGNALLDTSPLLDLIVSKVNFSNIRKQIDKGIVDVIGVTASSYASGWEITFVEGGKSVKPWERANRQGVVTEITHQHVMASSAIPIFFPPFKVGSDYYGDGCLRMTSPLSPAILLGAQRLFAIGIQYHASLHDHPLPTLTHSPSVAQIIGIVLNALFFDTLLTDHDHLEKVNQFLTSHADPRKRRKGEVELKLIESLLVLPSEDLGLVARRFSKRLPRAFRYLLKGLGRKPDEGMDLVSYLMFDKKYCTALIDIGYHDAEMKITEIEAFFGK